ncbi:hypothetical protein HQO83_02820 [Rhodococcus fascians]|nr:hypothetical protein [Rhodococcus fascians]
MNISVHQVLLDCTDSRRLAEFYRQLLGFEYVPGDAELPERGRPTDQLPTFGYPTPIGVRNSKLGS